MKAEQKGHSEGVAPEEEILEKAFISVFLHSALEKQRVADELSRAEWKITNSGQERRIQRDIDTMPASESMDVLVTVFNITRTDVEKLVIPLVRGISGVKEARSVYPHSHQ